MMKRVLYNWLPVAIWLVLIAMESTDTMSGAHTKRWLGVILVFFFGKISDPTLATINLVIRKTGHFAGYGILTLLSFRALKRTWAGSVRKWAAWAIVLTAIVASADEYHQTFIPSRTGCVQDAMLDTFGGIVMLLVALLALRFYQRRELAAE